MNGANINIPLQQIVEMTLCELLTISIAHFHLCFSFMTGPFFYKLFFINNNMFQNLFVKPRDN